MPERMRVEVSAGEEVSAIIYPSEGKPTQTLILGHGAGAGQAHPFMVKFATELAARGLNAVTFNFLYTERRRRVPDPNSKLEACYRAVIAAVRHEIGGSLAIGGKSMGGRIASQVAGGGADVDGLVFLGYPLHPPGKPEQLRTKHLPGITAPTLFVQGSRDAFGTPEELRPFIKALKVPVDLYVVEGGDHSFKVPKRGGILQETVYTAILDRIASWMRQSVKA